MNIDLKRKLEKRNNGLRWVLYYCMLAAVYLYMTTSRTVSRIPLFLIPIALCVAAFEEPFMSALTGCAAGIMLDSAQGTLVGVNGIIMLWACLFTSLVFTLIMRRHIINIVLITAVVTFVQGMVHYVFSYMIWDYDVNGRIFKEKFLPVMLYTVISAVFFYLIVKTLKKKIGLIKDSYLEEKSDDIVRE